MTKIVYQLDANGLLIGEVEADESPLEPGVYLVPAGCTEAPPPEPLPGKYLRYVNGEWAYEDPPPDPDPDPDPVKSIDEQRAYQWEAIKSIRVWKQDSGVLVNGLYWFHTDITSRIQQLGLKDAARDMLADGLLKTDPVIKLGSPVQWKLLDGSFLPMTAGLAYDVVNAVGDRDALLYKVAETHRANVYASDDPMAYDITTGWPLAFGEDA